MSTRYAVESTIQAKEVDLLIASPSQYDWAQINRYSDEQLRSILKIERAASAKAAIVSTPVSEIPTASRLLRLCGFTCFSHVLLTQSPPTPEVIDLKAIVTAERAKGELINVPFDWLPDGYVEADITDCAAKFAPGAQRCLNLFGVAWP